jgi:predicted RNase H-like HicB family nuclease
MTLVVAKVAYDPEARVWYVEWSDLPGLNVEAATVEQLQEQLPLAVADLIEASGEQGDFDIPIEIIAHSSLRARRQAA